MWKEALKGKEKTQMGLIFYSALVGLSFIYKWIYNYNLADITVSIYGARQSMRAHTNMYLLRMMRALGYFVHPTCVGIFPLEVSESLISLKQLLSQTQCATNTYFMYFIFFNKNPTNMFTYVFEVLIWQKKKKSKPRHQLGRDFKIQHLQAH